MAGVWSWSYAGGAFPVHVAPDGRFLCPQYPADSKWQCAGGGAVQMMVRVLRAPSPLNVEACMAPQHLEGAPDCRTIPLPPGAAEVLLPPVVRITVWPSEPAKGTCADAEEDILIALNY